MLIGVVGFQNILLCFFAKPSRKVCSGNKFCEKKQKNAANKKTFFKRQKNGFCFICPNVLYCVDLILSAMFACATAFK
jgi:hypothetical protein